MTQNVLITDRFAPEAESFLRGQTNVTVSKSHKPRPTAEELKNTNALIIRSRTRIDENLLKQAPQLKVIVTATSGFDHIDFKATEKANIKVMHTPDGNGTSASELTWALVLACARQVVKAHRAVKAGDWNRDQLTGFELEGKTYGIVGLGRIGSRVARFAHVFGMSVVAFDPYIEDFPPFVTRVSLEELFKQCDVISFHVPKTEYTHHMINRSTLEYLSRGVILVNTSRGSVMNENDVEWALEQGWIRALGLDVFEKEPLPRSSRLLTFENVVTTPHIGATTSEAFGKVSLEAARKVMAFLQSGSTSDELPPLANWYHSGSSFING